MAGAGGFYRSTIGRKIVMALTGVILVVFVLGHMSGNLLAFRGSAAFDAYSHFLQSATVPLWSLRGVLLIAVVFHIHSAWSLTRDARAARPERYDGRRNLAATPAARSMRWGGVLLLVFIVYHLLHFTIGTVHPSFVPGAAYANLISGLRIPVVAGFYLVAMLALGLHLRHGIWSVFQTLGVSHPAVERGRNLLAILLAVIVALGFAAVPAAILFGWVG
jgi:succinate dehydrogenase / fumarate reductase cytochrome b subunit